jgi:hypothetical protein
MFSMRYRLRTLGCAAVVVRAAAVSGSCQSIATSNQALVPASIAAKNTALIANIPAFQCFQEHSSCLSGVSRTGTALATGASSN